ncbi:MAG TPA: MBL fold metallo-hydrolase [Vicinamibacterales bacterium]|jgi:glyoxylase-like metal-dependent hydrolase (beta-lactamase superfamily II)
MKPSASALFFTLLVGLAAPAHAQTPMAHRFIEVAPGVYAAVGNGTIETRSSNMVIVNADDVFLVDTNITPEATRRLVNDIKTLTDKPIRYVVNTHWHYDHADGNQVFGPEVTIIGHENERTAILGGVLKNRLALEFQNLPGQLENLRKQAAEIADPVRQKQAADRLTVQEAYQEQLKETVPTPPTMTVADHLTLFRGDREIRVLYLGRGHSDTDLMVYLPKEKVVATGDFFEGPVTGALNFGFHDEWANNLEKLKAIDFETVVPGHGEPFKGKEQIAYFQAFLRDLWNQAKTQHDQKVPVAEAARQIDLTRHREHYRNINGPGFQEATIARIYQVLDQRGGSN